MDIQQKENGKVRIMAETAAAMRREEEIDVALYDGDSLIYTGQVNAWRKEPLVIETNTRRCGDSSRLAAVTMITNTTNSSTFSGTVGMDFAKYSGKAETRHFDNVRPGETVSVEIALPKQVMKQTMMLLGTVELENGYQIKRNFSFTQVDAAHTSTPPSMSGKLNLAEWQRGEWFATNKNSKGNYLTGKLYWDEENLYLLGIVEDSVFYQIASGYDMWNGDSIQLGICTASERVKGSNGQYTELGIAKTPEGMQIYRFNSQTMHNTAENALPSNVVVENAQSDLDYQDGKYIYRAKIPWTEIFGTARDIVKDTELGVSVLLNCNDGAGRSFVQFGGGIADGKDLTRYGLMKLIQ